MWTLESIFCIIYIMPIEIFDLKPASVVRIQLAPKLIFHPLHDNLAIVEQNVRPYPWRRTLIVARVQANDFPNRVMTVEYQDSTLASKHYVVTIKYQQIRVIELQ